MKFALDKFTHSAKLIICNQWANLFLSVPEILRILQLGLQSVMSVYHRDENEISTILEFCAAKIPKERRSQDVPIV